MHEAQARQPMSHAATFAESYPGIFITAFHLFANPLNSIMIEIN
jgi:hypothetical protein